MPNNELKRRFVSRQKPIQAGPVKLNYKLGWIALVLFLCFVSNVVAQTAGLTLVGIVLSALWILLYVLLIGIQPFNNLQTTALAKGYRVAHNKIGQTVYTADDIVLDGEVFGIKEDKRRKPKPIKRIGRVDVIPHETNGGILGVFFDHRYNALSATMWCAGSSLHSADVAGQERILTGFAGLLDDLAPGESPGHTLKWRFQTFLAEQQYPETTIAAIQKGAGLSREPAPNQDYLIEGLKEMGRGSMVHRTTMTLAIDKKAVKGIAKSMGGAEEVLARYAMDFGSAALGTNLGYSPIGVKAARLLSYNESVLEMRMALDPVFAQWLWERWAGPKSDIDLLSEKDAWPKYVNFKDSDEWCKLGSTYHKGFCISGLTRSGMFSDQFWNILKVPIPKTVTAVFNIESARHAQIRAEIATAGMKGTISDRQDAHRLITQAQQVKAEEVTRHEGEIARSQGQVGQVRIYIDLTAPNLEELNANAAVMRKAWTDARFMVEPLTGMQERGIDAVMPISRGLASFGLPDWL